MTETLKPAYTPRPQFLPFHSSHDRWRVLVAHRRSGKTVASVNELIERASYFPRNDGQFAYVAPQLKQAKRIAWAYLKRYSQHIAKRVNEAELYVELINGSKIFILGADDPDNARGFYFDGIVLDECAQIKPSFWTEVIRPALSDRRGWGIFLGTPKGKGNFFYTLYKRALSAPQKFFLLELKASQTGLIGPKELAELREDMDDAEYAQEYECSFDAALVGSYYGTHINTLARNGHIVVKDLWDRSLPVSVAMDLGYNDAATAWFWQINDGCLNFIDYEERTGLDAEEFIQQVFQQKPYRYDIFWLPHDAKHKTFATKKSVIDTFRDYYEPNQIKRAPDPDAGNRVFHGIDAVRKVLRKYPIYFCKTTCEQGLESLKNYSREWSHKQSQFLDHPKHDKWSHGADAFRYACLSIQIEDIINSLDRAIRREEQKSSYFSTLRTKPIVNTTWTLNDASEAYLKKKKAQSSLGRARIG